MAYASHTFTENAPVHAVLVSDYDWDAVWAEEQKLSAMSAAWDALAEAALDFETDAYARAHSRWNALSGDVG